MPGERHRVSIAPFLGVNSRRVADTKLGGSYMRGAYNFELKDGEWWTRQGESRVGAGGGSTTQGIRYGSCPWWWLMDINSQYAVIANAWWALGIDSNSEVSELYAPAIEESVTFANGSANATSATTRVVDQMLLVGASGVPTRQVHRVKSRVGTAMVLERPFEGTSGAKTCRFIDPLARGTTGTATAYSFTTARKILGSAVIFEQLVTHGATTVHGTSPATTGGNLYLIITSNLGVPVAIDLTGYIGASPAAVLRSWFFNTALAMPLVIGSNGTFDNLQPRGVWAEVYGDRLFLAAATDPNGAYGSRTIWYSQIGDFLQWHTGIQGQTAAPNFKTFSGEGNAIGGLATLQDSLVVHRCDSQEIGSITGSLAQPFNFRSNSQGVGVRATNPTNRVIKARGANIMWTPQGPAVFDGNQVSLIAEDARGALAAHGFVVGQTTVTCMLHDAARGRVCVFTVGARHQDALPATATITLASGDQITNYVPCFVFDYLNGTYWFEDHPQPMGGGMMTIPSDSLDGATPYLSRLDGTIVKLVVGAANLGADPSYLAPETTGSDVAVNCQVDTPWLDFGDTHRKHFGEMEMTLRALHKGESRLDRFGVLTSAVAWVRARFYVDMQELTARSGFGVAYDGTAASLDQAAEFNQAATGIVKFSPRFHGTRVKAVITNALTSAATSAGYVQSPLRISDLIFDYQQAEGIEALTTLNVPSGFIVE